MSHPHGGQPESAYPPAPAPDPMFGQPIAAAPTATADPAAQFQPGSAPVPVSAVPAHDPYATAAYAPPQPPRKGRAGTIVLSIATGVLVLATAGLGVLYFLESDARKDTEVQLAQRTTALTEAEAKAKTLDSQLQASKEDNAKLNQDLTGAKNKTDEVTKARDALAGCFLAIEEYARSKTAANAKAAEEKCTEAEKHY